MKVIVKVKDLYEIVEIKNSKVTNRLQCYKLLNTVKEEFIIEDFVLYMKKKGNDTEVSKHKKELMLKKLRKHIVDINANSPLYVVIKELEKVEDLPWERTEFELEEEKKWWAKINSMCLKCTQQCKQSSKVEILACPLFVKKE